MLYREETANAARSTVVIHTPAKLNLFLKVLGKRHDGYHELETLMVSVGLYDTLAFSNSRGGLDTKRDAGRPAETALGDAAPGAIELQCFDAAPLQGASYPPLSSGSDNLVVRAAELLRAETKTSQGARIHLFKRIPQAAGLGGGSSDAAAALFGLNRLWKLGLSTNELAELGARLGSDIPFFLHSCAAAICKGRGEIVEPVLQRLSLWFVVARPATGLSTALVYKHCRPSTIDWPAEELVSHLARGTLAQASRRFHNALEAPALGLNADVGRLKAAFARLPFAGHMMSGSGTAYFGLCGNRPQARQLASRLKASRLGDVFVVSCRP
jgi:4-diphosphocytidyl-2-C-methyl-D-erythritol kinase